MRLLLKALAVSAIVVALVASPTQARLKRGQTHFVEGSIVATRTGEEVTRFVGAITSTRAKCVPGRPVDITFGPSQSLQQPFGSGTTDAEGRFDVSGSAPDGSFFTIYVQKVRLRNLVCKSKAAFGQF